MASKLSSFEKRFKLEEDARTLVRYQEIMSDSKRKAAAIREAKKQAGELEKRASVMKKAAGGNVGSNRKIGK